jgi:hypothetical protein
MKKAIPCVVCDAIIIDNNSQGLPNQCCSKECEDIHLTKVEHFMKRSQELHQRATEALNAQQIYALNQRRYSGFTNEAILEEIERQMKERHKFDIKA